MALIDNRAQVIEERWVYPGTDGAYVAEAYSVVPADALALVPPSVRPLGVFVSAGTAVDVLISYLNKLDLIAVEFPKFRDGRGFTMVRTLRTKYGFQGDIRAIGYVLPDQFAPLVQCGFSSIVTSAEHPPEQWQQKAASLGGTPPKPLVQRMINQRARVPNSLE
ncbi:DUF934 domain-containing protein [Mesorhizobium sp. SB112]|uniref:DUF934 domain-containing protein n=1 Tax=Mesorhizobium sp. SB112 TaxID=3151853 RepID=UPI003265E8C0